jgi:predicted RNA-binding Zn ribbon-like protein
VARTGIDASRWRPAKDTLADAVDLREALYRLFAAVSSDTKPNAADLATLNTALARAPARSRLQCDDGRFVWQIDRATRDLPALLAPVLWSAADLLAGPRRSRVRLCANPECRFAFLDDSKAGNRRWCAMSACGNRAKAHRHYLKKKGRLTP